LEKDFCFSTGVNVKPHYAFDPHVPYADRLFDLDHWIRVNSSMVSSTAPTGPRPFPELHRSSREHVRLLRLWREIEVARARLAATQAAVAHTGQPLPSGYAYDVAWADAAEAKLRVGEHRAALRGEREKERPSPRVIARLQHRLRLAGRRHRELQDVLEDAEWEDMLATFAECPCDGGDECKPGDPCRPCLARTRLAALREDESAKVPH